MTLREPAPKAPPTHAISASGLTISRGDRVLLQHLAFEVAAGQLLLLRGPNGAGKTTLLLALYGVVRQDAGSIAFTGRDPELRPGEDVHYLGHRAAIKPRLTVRENLAFWAAVNGSGGGIVEALEQVGLAAIAGLDAGYLSAGQTRRLALARLLVTKKPYWLLDEPTAALDNDGEILVGRLVDAHLAGGGVAIAATHHDLAVAKVTKTITLGAAA